MDKNLANELKEKLEIDKANIEKELKKFAKKDENVSGDWDTIFPHYDGDSGGASLERSADEVEQFSTLLPIEYSLETQLRDIDLALEKIKRDKYGKCDNCKTEINEDRLKAYPAARLCISCENKK